MPAEPRKYTPIYRDIVDEPAIYDDDVLFATYIRLRITADAAWPEPAVLPRSAADDAVARLVAAGKIALLGRDLFRCRGVDLDRSMRSKRGLAGAEARWAAN